MVAAHPLGALAPLADYPQFIVAIRDGKVPVHPGTCTPHSAHDPAIWCTYEAAAEIVAAWGPQSFGVGFVLTEADPFACIDIDGALQPDGTWSALSHELCASLPGSVVEVSQSGRGLHVWLRASRMPAHTCKDTARHTECYHAGRYILLGTQAAGTMAADCPAIHDVVARYFPPSLAGAGAGDIPDDGPCAEWSGPADDDALLEIAMRSRSMAGAFGGKATFAQLFSADVDALARYYPGEGRAFDASSADMALAQWLAFYTGNDGARIDRMMRRSALARDKWDRPDYLPRTIEKACRQQGKAYRGGTCEALPTPATVAPAAVQSLSFAAAAAGWIDAKLETVFDALQSKESGVRIGLDSFQARIMIAGAEGNWRRFGDAHYGHLRATFGKRGFKAISPEIMKTAVLMAAEENVFDSAVDWVNGLQWDGVPRIDSAMPRYYRTADTPYTRAVGAYLFTGVAARALVPGAQVDMVPVLVGLQGARKTSAVQALSPDKAFFCEINLKKIDDADMSRHIRGKLIGEIAELRGLAGRDQESVKAWITRREEEWRPTFREYEVTYGRRLVLIGTANEREFLDDPTGERRWLPLIAGAVDVESIERDREQLWAEGAHRFKASGVAWRDAERLARAEHEAFKIADPWADLIEQWLSEPGEPGGRPRGEAPFKMADLCLGALHRSVAGVQMLEAKRVAKILKTLGFASGNARIVGKVGKAWARVPPLPPVAP